MFSLRLVFFFWGSRLLLTLVMLTHFEHVQIIPAKFPLSDAVASACRSTNIAHAFCILKLMYLGSVSRRSENISNSNYVLALFEFNYCLIDKNRISITNASQRTNIDYNLMNRLNLANDGDDRCDTTRRTLQLRGAHQFLHRIRNH